MRGRQTRNVNLSQVLQRHLSQLIDRLLIVVGQAGRHEFKDRHGDDVPLGQHVFLLLDDQVAGEGVGSHGPVFIGFVDHVELVENGPGHRLGKAPGLGLVEASHLRGVQEPVAQVGVVGKILHPLPRILAQVRTAGQRNRQRHCRRRLDCPILRVRRHENPFHVKVALGRAPHASAANRFAPQ